jgi:hypothetical protein
VILTEKQPATQFRMLPSHLQYLSPFLNRKPIPGAFPFEIHG